MRYWNPQNFAVIGLAVCTACSDDKAPAPTSVEQTITGRLYSVDGFPISGATVSTGVGGLGSLTAGPSAQTDDTGAFSLVVAGAVRDVVLVTFEADGYADHHVRRSLTGVGELDATSVISSAQPMVCRSGVCETDGLTILGLPEGIQGAARAFDPSANLDAFPGDFDEVNGAGLESGGFVWVGLRDAQGNPVTTLDSPATLDVVLQRPSWPAIRDTKPGNGQVDVPLYAFDPDAGTWRLESEAVLYASSGEKVAETDIPAINAKTFPLAINARGEVSHFSYWNIDWAVEDRSSTRIRVNTAVSGTLFGTSYVGRSTGIASTASTGAGTGAAVDPKILCFDGPRSEKSGEDADGDGIIGETQRGNLILQSGNKFYLITEQALSDTAGGCDAPTGDIQDIELTDADLLSTQICDISGRVVDLDGKPVSGGVVSIKVSSFAMPFREQICATAGCVETGTSDGDGNFTLRAAVAFSSKVNAIGLVTPPEGSSLASRSGTVSFRDCPTEPVQIVADEGADFYSFSVDLTGDVITWDPPIEASRIVVTQGQSFLKWQLRGPAASPVTYGDVPAGASQDVPSNQTPPSAGIQTGDLIRVFGAQAGPAAYREIYEGRFEVP